MSRFMSGLTSRFKSLWAEPKMKLRVQPFYKRTRAGFKVDLRFFWRPIVTVQESYFE